MLTRLRGQSTRGVKTDIKRQTFRVANFPSVLQTDASDYGIGEYVFMVTNGKVRVVRFFSKALVGAQLNWSVQTDYKNLTYLNVTLTGKILRWKLISKIKTSTYVMFPERRFIKGYLTPCHAYARTTCQ